MEELSQYVYAAKHGQTMGGTAVDEDILADARKMLRPVDIEEPGGAHMWSWSGPSPIDRTVRSVPSHELPRGLPTHCLEPKPRAELCVDEVSWSTLLRTGVPGLLKAVQSGLSDPGCRDAGATELVGDEDILEPPRETPEGLVWNGTPATHRTVVLTVASIVHATAARMGLPSDNLLGFSYMLRAYQPHPQLELRPEMRERLRDYQLAAASSTVRVCDNGRLYVRCGGLYMDCGAGKTAAALCVAAAARRPVFVLCHSRDAVMQWRSEFMRWTHVRNSDICMVSGGDVMGSPMRAHVVISNYCVMSSVATGSSGEGGTRYGALLRRLASDTFLVVCDEMQYMAAATYRRVSRLVRGPVLGLTATPWRMDEGMPLVTNYLVGPPLVRTHLRALVARRYVIQVQPIMVIPSAVGLPPPLNERPSSSLCHPLRIYALAAVSLRLLAHGQAVLVFTERLVIKSVLHTFFDSLRLGAAYVGAVDSKTRKRDAERAYAAFRARVGSCLIVVSDVGNVGLNLPNVTDVVEAPKNRSPREAVQRGGRSSRPSGRSAYACIHSIALDIPTELARLRERHAPLRLTDAPVPVTRCVPRLTQDDMRLFFAALRMLKA